MSVKRAALGDWQTPPALALAVCRQLKAQGCDPQVILEPTCGSGSFIAAALETFPHLEQVWGIEIQEAYLQELKAKLTKLKPAAKVELIHADIFAYDLSALKERLQGRRLLLLGNPPWVTNSAQGRRGSANLPEKRNIDAKRGIEALTGSSNFDISESICLKLLSFAAGEKAQLALLLKTAVIRKLLASRRRQGLPVTDAAQYNLDSRKEFQASVAAALFTCRIGREAGVGEAAADGQCRVFDFYRGQYLYTFGWAGTRFVSDWCSYEKNACLDGRSCFIWRSGVKHDCAKVMELSGGPGAWVNGLNERVQVEEEAVYPLLKSSDLKGEVLTSCRLQLILTQLGANEDPALRLKRCPQLAAYLYAHAALLDGRASAVYRRRPRFALFGLGDYSFKPYKIAVSGLARSTRFALVMPIAGKPVMLDDTCYQLGFDHLGQARAVWRALNSKPVQQFFKAVVFADAKRPVTKELLMRLDWGRLCLNLKAEELELNKEDFTVLQRLVADAGYKQN